jgi:signal transduction histidine kinase
MKFEYKAILLYLILGSLWIAFSDNLLRYFVSDPAILTRLQTYKGWFYVCVTAVLFYIILKRHLVKLRNAENRARESDVLKSAFLQNISHEIRTPMNSIVGFADLLKENNIEEGKKSEYLKIINTSSHHLLNIINEILDISMIESGNVEISENEVNLNKLLNDTYEFFQPLVKKEVTFSLLKGLPDQHSFIQADEVKLKKVISNIINNAMKFTEKGHIVYGYSVKEGQLEFYVEDSGIGIPEDSMLKIFSHFQKAEPGISRIYDGVGLGLSISKGIVDLMKGKMWVNSIPGKGSTFYFTFPYKPVIKPAGPMAVDNRVIEELNGMKILIAEDDEANYKYLNLILQGAGIDSMRAETGKEAVEICRRIKEIGLILMDLKMPIMSGFEATRKIKQFRPDIHIIAQTAYAMFDEIQRALNAGCDDYIAKPYNKEQILAMIAKYH